MRSPRHWFLPKDTDPLAALRAQMAITVEGMAAFEAWARGDTEAAERVRACEHDADEAKIQVRSAVRDAFITPISPEDIFVLSGHLDKILNWSKDTVRESEVMAMPPDADMAVMADRIHEGILHLSRAFGAIDVNHGGDGGRAATEAADAATKSARKLEKVYRHAMSDLLPLEERETLRPAEVRELIGRRELYRRMSRIAEALVDVADRVWYASVKEL
jgi:uncharacterized protein Yka (UPF0111/DUF47 family)